MLHRAALFSRPGARALRDHAPALLLRRAPLASFSSAALPTASDSNSNDVTDLYDVVVVGGGMIGATLACALHTAPTGRRLRVLALDGAKPPRPPSAFAPYSPNSAPPAPTLRTVALSPQSAALLSRLGVWEGVRATGRVGAYSRMRVWDSHANPGPAEVEWRADDAAVFGSDDHHDHLAHDTAAAAAAAAAAGGAPPSHSGPDALGYVVENDLLHAHVYTRLAELSAASHAPAAPAEGVASVPPESAVSNPVWRAYLRAQGTVDVRSGTPVTSVTLPPRASDSSAAVPPAATAAATAAVPSAESVGPHGTSVSPSFPRLRLADGSVVAARLVVGADGRDSFVKAAAGLSALGWSYHQRAAVCTVRLSEPLTTAYQRFLPTGPVALLPLYGGLANVVWSTTPAHAVELCSCPPEEYIRQLTLALAGEPEAVSPSSFTASAAAEREAQGGNGPLFPPTPTAMLKHLGGLAGWAENLWKDPFPAPLRALLPQLKAAPSQLDLPSNGNGSGSASAARLAKSSGEAKSGEVLPQALEVVGPRAGFPLHLSLGTEYVAPRVALVGDAAHVVHPMAGQGVNLGFGDVEVLAAELDKGLAAGADVGDYHVLKKYELKQLPINAAGLLGVDLISRAFRLEGPLALARSAGLALFNAFPAAKRFAAEFAMGVAPRAAVVGGKP